MPAAHARWNASQIRWICIQTVTVRKKDAGQLCNTKTDWKYFGLARWMCRISGLKSQLSSCMRMEQESRQHVQELSFQPYTQHTLKTVRKDSTAARSTLASSARHRPTLAPHKHIHNEWGRGAQTVLTLSSLKKVLYFMSRSPRNRD